MAELLLQQIICLPHLIQKGNSYIVHFQDVELGTTRGKCSNIAAPHTSTPLLGDTTVIAESVLPLALLPPSLSFCGPKAWALKFAVGLRAQPAFAFLTSPQSHGRQSDLSKYRPPQAASLLKTLQWLFIDFRKKLIKTIDFK